MKWASLGTASKVTISVFGTNVPLRPGQWPLLLSILEKEKAKRSCQTSVTRVLSRTETRRKKGLGAAMKILVGNVDTDERWAALKWAMEEAGRRNAEIVVTTSMHPHGSLDAQAEKVLAYREELEEVERQLTDADIPHTLHKYMRGKSGAEEVIQDALDEGADMIVIGIPRRSLSGKPYLSSAVQDILINASCPVMVVKGDQSAD